MIYLYWLDLILKCQRALILHVHALNCDFNMLEKKQWRTFVDFKSSLPIILNVCH